MRGKEKKERINKMTSDDEIARVKFMLANRCGHSVELYDSQ